MQEKTRTVRRLLTVAGQVQGVGFRPFVYRLAQEEGLCGGVGNTSDGVRIDIQGSAAAVARFEARLRSELPPLARLTGLAAEEAEPEPGLADFRIFPSSGHAGHSVLVSPDVGICDDCLADMADPQNPRYAYPFTNCTNCGPRYTITRSIPYDRATTSMACFPLCPACAAEYADPGNRRFHAQPVACPHCGPHVWYADAAEMTSATGPADAPRSPEREHRALERAARALHEGRLLALKGLGGFQLACRADDAAAVERLRERKQRPHKAFALMAATLDDVRRYCLLSPDHEALLLSPEKPVVLCPRRPDGSPAPAAAVAPDVDTLGFMLPYTPLHVMLFHELARICGGQAPVLVMTSANAGGEPLCLGNREALRRLAGMADAWLLHDRDILVRVDDSVVGVTPHGAAEGDAAARATPFFYRRARGYVPRPVFLRDAETPPVLGCGAELKATLCLTRANEAFVGQHIGDLENPAVLAFYEECAVHLEQLLEVRPQAVVCDLHPDFLSTRYAEARAARDGIPLWRLQHHAAHAAAVLAENGHFAPALALCLDGTGLGTDGSVWGGELLYMDLSVPRWERLGRLSPFPLPGGDAAVHAPWRIAFALRQRCGDVCNPADAVPPSCPEDERRAAGLLAQMLERGVQCPPTSSCGRLFDAVSAELGLCGRITYEGQAALRLEQHALFWRQTHAEACLRAEAAAPDRLPEELLARGVSGLLELSADAVFRRVREDARRDTAFAAWRFHELLARAFAHMAFTAARERGLAHVGLSGGVLNNALLARRLPECLRACGLTPLVQEELPPGDGGLSLGQAAWGRALWRAGKETHRG